jgi:hypothetical protein
MCYCLNVQFHDQRVDGLFVRRRRRSRRRRRGRRRRGRRRGR